MYAQGSSDDDMLPMSFVSASTGLGGTSSQHSVWFGDINNDSFLDIASAGYMGVRVWTGNGAGVWTPASTNLPTTTYDGGICLGDINSDGNLDIAASNYNFGMAGIGVWLGNGAGSWTSASNGLPNTNWFAGIFLGDVNNDDNLDIVVGHEGNGIKVFTGNGEGIWTEGASTNLPNTGEYYGIWMDDVNNDNNLDIVAAGKDGLHVWLGDGAGVWTEASNGPLSFINQWNSVTLGDINLDGNLDIVAAMDGGAHGIRAYLGDGTSNWTEVSNGLPTTGLYYSVIVADLAGDKYPDILAAGYWTNGGIRLWKGNGGSSWIEESSGLPTTGKFIGVDAGDIDNDGYLDIVGVGENVDVQVWRRDEVTPPLTATVIEANGGENWEIGAQKYIKWTASGGTSPLTIRIEYSIEGVIGQYTMIIDSEPNDGSFLWTVPTPPLLPSLDCYIRVNVTDANTQTNWDKSDSAFGIYTPDTTPPIILNLQPLNQSTVYNNKPIVGASYSDPFGINASGVILEVDTMNVTSSATITENDVTYIPDPALSDGIHDIYLEVRDDTINQNLATASWWFIVDTPPTIQVFEPGGSPDQKYTQGDIIPVAWFASDANPLPANPINITVVIPPFLSVTIATNEPNDGIYNWDTSTVPCPATYGMNISVYDSIGQTSFNFSKYGFFIFCPGDSPPIITAWEPGGTIGQTYTQGDIITVKWTASDDIPLPPNPINITYGNLSGWTTIATSESNDQIYGWDTSTIPCPGAYWMNLSVYDSIGQEAYDLSNYSFDINCPDTTPPIINNLQPANESTFSDNMPIIAASYNDASGIDTNSVILRLDAIDVTSSATVTSTDVTYTPAALPDGVRNVYLEVNDNSPAQNKAAKTWWFTVDTTPPTVTNLHPVNESSISDNLPVISADYNDVSGVNLSSVVLKVDSVDITAFALISTSDVTYTPVVPLPDGVHNIYLKVSDNSAPENTGAKIWWFTVDTKPPTITDLQPANSSTINSNTPVIGASYNDTSIDIGSVILKIDNINVTAYASMNESAITYTPAGPLLDGIHSVYLYVGDSSTPGNTATETWSFTIDTTPPTIYHEPVSIGTAGNDITITAEVTDDGGMDSVSLYYRSTENGPFNHVSMTKTSPDTYTGTIPGSAVTAEGVQYYIEANDALNNTGRRPKTDWEESPYTIEVSGFPWILAILGLITIILIALTIIILLKQGKKKNSEKEIIEEEEATEEEDTEVEKEETTE